jgi:uncharacterized protein with PIN domain
MNSYESSIKILCDQMLGTLAKWLRILGFDTFFPDNEISDIEILYIARKENRIIISRDKDLINRAKKERIKNLEMKFTKLDLQLNLVLENLGFSQERFLSRCTICNTDLEKVDKKIMKKKVPKRVFENNEIFWYCPKCSKYYWMGTHYEKMIERINEIKIKYKSKL